MEKCINKRKNGYRKGNYDGRINKFNRNWREEEKEGVGVDDR